MFRLMRRWLVVPALAAGLLGGESMIFGPPPRTALAQPTQPGQPQQATPPPGLPAACRNVNPAQTADPGAVAAAQAAISGFYLETASTWSMEGYSSADGMRTTEGNNQSDWLDQTLALACGRLQGGYKGMNWTPGTGWGHR
jgi:hypothetical protein